MKLHLPTALFALAVLPAVAYGEVNTFDNGATATYTYGENHSTVRPSTGIDNSMYNGHVDVTYQGNFYGVNDLGNNALTGHINAIPTNWTHDGKIVDAFQSASATITGENSRATAMYVAPATYAVMGDKTLKVEEGAYVTYLYAGYYHFSTAANPEKNYINHESAFASIGENHYQKGDIGATINVEVNNAYVTQIYLGSYINGKVSSSTAANYDALNNPPWALNEKIVLDLNNAKVGYAANKTQHSTLVAHPEYNAIAGSAPSTPAAYNEGVSIRIHNGSDIVGSIYAGPDAYSGISAYAKSISISLEDTSNVSGWIYAGGSGQNADSKSYIKENTKIVLAGGTVEKDVYAGGGAHSVVEGNTEVVIKGEGTDVKGTIYGGGNSETSVVKGDKILAFEGYTGNTFDISATHKVGDTDVTNYKGFDTLKFKENAGDLELVNISDANNEVKHLVVEASSKVTAGDLKLDELSIATSEVIINSLENYSDGVEGTKATVSCADLTVNGALKLAEGSSVVGLNYSAIVPGLVMESTVTAKSIDIEGGHVEFSSLTATEGGISMGDDSELKYAHLTAKTDVVLNGTKVSAPATPPGYEPYGDSVITAETGNIVIKNGSSIADTDLSALNGTVSISDSTMTSGGIDAEKVEIVSSSVTVDRGLNATSGGLEISGTDSSIKVNGGNIDFLNFRSNNSTLEHTGNDTLQIRFLVNFGGENTIKQSGNGTMNIDGPPATQFPTHMVQTGKGEINFDGGANLESLTLEGGGTVRTNARSTVSTLAVSGESTFENYASLSLNQAKVDGGALVNMGDMNVSGALTLQNATLTIKSGSAIALGDAASVTLLNGADAINAVNIILTYDEAQNLVSNPGNVTITLFEGLSDLDAAAVAGAIASEELSFAVMDAAGNVTGQPVSANGSVGFDAATGSVTWSGSVNVPEPTTATLSLLALAGLCARRRRK